VHEGTLLTPDRKVNGYDDYSGRNLLHRILTWETSSPIDYAEVFGEGKRMRKSGAKKSGRGAVPLIRWLLVPSIFSRPETLRLFVRKRDDLEIFSPPSRLFDQTSLGEYRISKARTVLTSRSRLVIEAGSTSLHCLEPSPSRD